jgi:putative endonuclease
VLKSSYLIGLDAESRVQEFYTKKGLTIVAHRWRTPFAEVDLVFKDSQTGSLLLVEVKKSSYSEFRVHLLSVRQKQRLNRVITWLAEQAYQVEIRLVIVDENGEIEEFKDVFD